MAVPIRTVLNNSSIYEVRNLDKLDATVDPTVNNDETEGYSTKSYWYNTSTGNMFICLDPTEGAAVWADTTLTLGDLGTAALNDTGDFATAAQGALADTATQPGDLATVATTGSYNDLVDEPDISEYLKVNGDVDWISAKSDFPAAVGGVITLSANHTYFIGATIDLTGDRLVLGVNTALVGSSPEISKLKSTGLNAAQPGDALITATDAINLRSVTLDGNSDEGYPLLDLDGSTAPSGSPTLDWTYCNFVDATTVGTIKDYNDVILETVGVLSAANFTFDGTFNTIGIDNSILVGLAGEITGIIASTATINRRFRLTYSAVVTPATGTGLEVQSAASFPNAESAILDTVSFSGGGVPSTGTLVGTNKGLFVNVSGGVTNNNGVGEYYLENNATATTITVAGTYYKIAGTTTAGVEEKFEMSLDNEFTYNGAFTTYVKVDVDSVVSSGSNNQNIGIRVYKDDGGGYAYVAGSTGLVRASTASQPYQVGTHVIVTLSPGDKVSIYVTNETSTAAVTVEELNVVALRVG